MTSLELRCLTADRELLDWMQAEVIVCRAAVDGWWLRYWGVCGLPATESPEFFKTKFLREALAQAKAKQEGLRAEYAARLGQRLTAMSGKAKGATA